MKRTLFVLIAALALVIAISACAAPTEAPKPTAAPQPTAVPAQPTSAPAQPTAAPKPTEAPKPTAAAAAPTTAAPAPTAAPAAAGPTATGVAKATAVPVPAGATKFDFWHAMGAPNDGYINEMMGRFNASQTKCYGTAIYQGAYDDSLNKIKAGLASKDVPALAQMYDLATG